MLRSVVRRIFHRFRYTPIVIAFLGNNKKFIPGARQWIKSKYYTGVNSASGFCGDIFRGSSILDVGCGEMLMDFGLLRLHPNSITGLDISPLPEDHLSNVANKLRKHRITVPKNYRSKLSHVQYDGEAFPFSDEQYDIVFSWSAFEHIQNVDRVLSEIHRVLKPEGKAFIQVFPWFKSLHGSHLSDWLDEPYFHLRQPDEWVFSRLEAKAADDAENRDFILAHMWPEYRSLNRISARDFYRSVLGAGFKVVKARVISSDRDLSLAPPDADFADLMMAGTMMLLAKT